MNWLKDGTLGEWWTPEMPNAKRVGVLRRISDVWQLDILGTLGRYQHDQYDRRYEVIHGWIPSAGFIAIQQCTAWKQQYPGPKEHENQL